MKSCRSRTRLTLSTLVLAALVSSGCASIVSGKHQKIRVTSDPSGAIVTVNGEQRGMTPLVTEVRRKDKTHTVEITLDGYAPYAVTLHRRFNAWYLGNLGFGGLIGFAVDPITGAMFRMDRDSIEARLERSSTSLWDAEGDPLYVMLTTAPDPTWQRIGALKRLGED